MAHAAKHLAAGGLDSGGRIGFQRMAEGIVDSDEEPVSRPSATVDFARLVVSA
jgi:hypothetical protein